MDFVVESVRLDLNGWIWLERQEVVSEGIGEGEMALIGLVE